MSVYTHISSGQCQAFLHLYGYRYLSHQAISSGIENSSFFVNIDHTSGLQEMILTMFEQLAEPDILATCMVLNHLKAQGLAVAPPVMQLNGAHLGLLANKPAWLCHKLPGAHVSAATAPQCQQIGHAMANIHNALQNPVVLAAVLPVMAEQTKPNTPQQWLTQFNSSLLSTNQQSLLKQLIALCANVADLPMGLVHADLFSDNVLFVGSQVTGIIDFANLCYHHVIYDLAICINDFCSLDDGHLAPPLVSAMLQGYQQVRPLQIRELEALPTYMALAAGRFWLSRLLQPSHDGAIATAKPAQTMLAMLQLRLAALSE